MFDTRLIYQTVDWERRIEIEKEKQGNHRLELCAPFSNSVELCCKAIKSLSTLVAKLNRGDHFSNHPSEPNGALENPLYNAS
jgi:hypothetical protein